MVRQRAIQILKNTEILGKLKYGCHFYQLSGCLKVNFGPLTRRKPHSHDVDHCAFSHSKRGLPERWVSKPCGAHQWDLKGEFYILRVTSNPTVLISPNGRVVGSKAIKTLFLPSTIIWQITFLVKRGRFSQTLNLENIKG